MGKARVQSPAPDFRGIAVIDGDFKEIQLSDYIGIWILSYFFNNIARHYNKINNYSYQP